MYERRTFNRLCRMSGPAWGTLFLHTALVICVQGGITNEGPLTVFRTDTNDALLSFSLPFDVPATNESPRLDFTFGFATDEPDAAGTFFDSFSATLQSSNQSATALLLTADRTGVAWAPPNPGGLEVVPADLSNAATNFPSLSPSMGLQYAYAVSYLLPVELTGGLVTLFFDFFDNLNQFASLAFVRDVRIETSVVVPPGALVLESSASVIGPFAPESGVTIDLTNRILTLPRSGAARFFRLVSDLPARINRLNIGSGQLLFDYAFQPNVLVLQSAALVEGPYADETNTVADTLGQTLSIAVPSGTRFFRLRSDLRTSIARQEIVGNQLVFHYAFQPQFLKLQSSAAVAGPYADENGVANDAAVRTLSIPRFGQTRFYRLLSDQATRIASMTVTNGNLILHFQ